MFVCLFVSGTEICIESQPRLVFNLPFVPFGVLFKKLIFFADVKVRQVERKRKCDVLDHMCILGKTPGQFQQSSSTLHQKFLPRQTIKISLTKFCFLNVGLGVPGWLSRLSVRFLVSAQVMISVHGFQPCIGSVLTVQSLLGILSLLSLPPPPLTLFVSFSKINLEIKKVLDPFNHNSLCLLC